MEIYDQFKCQAYFELTLISFLSKQVLVTNSLGGEAFPTKPFNNKCVTDVVFTNVDSEGTHQVCLKSW